MLSQLLSTLLALRGFFVEQGGFSCTAPDIAGFQYGYDKVLLATGYVQFIANANPFSGPTALAVYMDLATTDGFRCQVAGFEKSCRPQPFIQSDSSCFGGLEDMIQFDVRPGLDPSDNSPT